MRNRFALAALFVAIAAPDSGAGAAANRIEGIQHAASGAVTTIRVRGSRTPTFTVYTLERPARVVVDLAPAEMSSALRGAGDGGAAGEDGATFGVNSWSVQRVSAHESGEGSRSGVRVVISLARDEYPDTSSFRDPEIVDGDGNARERRVLETQFLQVVEQLDRAVVTGFLIRVGDDGIHVTIRAEVVPARLISAPV